MAERYTIGLFKGYGRFAHHVIEMIVLLPCFFQFIVIKREMICVSDDTFMEVGKYILGNIVVMHFHLPFLIAPGGWSTYRGS